MANIYIHIPFCKSKCKYCSFVSYPLLSLKEEYIFALSEEIKSRYKFEEVDTLYFGGGTPSLLSKDEIFSITKFFNITEKTEFTIELNPESVSLSYLKDLKDIGVNRLSFGCQTFDDKILKYIGRRHNSKQVLNSLEYAYETGFENISIDFIYGLPGQTIEMFESDLNKALNLNIQHISLYGLKIDEDCYFAKDLPKNLPDDDMQADMYLKAIDILKNDFEHYEISNFAKKDSGQSFYSIHNLNYWNNKNYYGFGCAAHGYEGNVRYCNAKNIHEYILKPTEFESFKELTEREKLEEEIFLGFRKMDGINVKEINSKYNINFVDKYKKIIDKYVSLNYLKETNKGYKLSVNGVLISNLILSEFL